MRNQKLIKVAPTIVFVYFIIFFYYNAADASRTNFNVKQFEVCNNTQGQIKFYGNITHENDDQYLNYVIFTPVEWGDNLGMTCLIESGITEELFVELFTIREKNICKAAQMYMGEVWYDIQRRSGHFNPRSCPLPAGKYLVHHMKLDFKRLALQTFPFGRLRFTINAIDNRRRNAKMLCLYLDVENLIN